MKGICRYLTFALMAEIFLSPGCGRKNQNAQQGKRLNIIASDTLLSGMTESLLPPDGTRVTAIMPPGQCPGHYDVKLSDIEKVKSADLVVAFRDTPFMGGVEIGGDRLLLLDAEGRNWMAPDSYIVGLKLLAGELVKRFPQERAGIEMRLRDAIGELTERVEVLRGNLRRSGIPAMPVIAASMQKEPLEWMGCRVIGEYGRPEAMSAGEIVRLTRIGKENNAAMIVDNLQSGPETGKGIADALGVPHVVLSNFPAEAGYAATLSRNVQAVLAAAETR